MFLGDIQNFSVLDNFALARNILLDLLRRFVGQAALFVEHRLEGPLAENGGAVFVTQKHIAVRCACVKGNRHVVDNGGKQIVNAFDFLLLHAPFGDVLHQGKHKVFFFGNGHFNHVQNFVFSVGSNIFFFGDIQNFAGVQQFLFARNIIFNNGGKFGLPFGGVLAEFHFFLAENLITIFIA